MAALIGVGQHTSAPAQVSPPCSVLQGLSQQLCLSCSFITRQEALQHSSCFSLPELLAVPFAVFSLALSWQL